MEQNFNTAVFLKEHEISPSFQRLQIYNYLIDNKNHPVVDTIYQSLIATIPTLSKTTVYNTLKLFVEKGIASMITIKENEVCYDADTTEHGHFICENCHTVYDFRYTVGNIKFVSLDNFKINEQHLYLKGVCKNCL